MDEISYMERALELANQADGSVSPRPPVGAVIVSPDGEIVGEGSSTDGPGRHAEVAALRAAGERARGAICFATLEPCLKWCTPALIDAGVRRVVSATTDPNPRVDGQGYATLRDAGVLVQTGLLEGEAHELIEPFAKWVKTGSPFVTLKLAASLDGKVAAADGTSRWITGDAARADVHELRRRADAICVGSGTVLADDPLLTYRGDRHTKQPLRVVLDARGRVPAHAKVRNADAPTLVLTTADVPEADGGLDLEAVLALLGARGICHVLVEGGPTLAASLMERGVVDRLIVYLAPMIIGGDAPGLLASGVKTLTDAWHMRIERISRVGEDIRIDARPDKR